MNIILKYKIEKDSDLLFAKIDITNFVKKKNYFVDYITFAIMELGTNLIKYAENGEIWLLEENEEYMICALDRGKGIADLEWATRKGTTTYKNSLGLGLYQLSQNNIFDILIFTSTTPPSGTVVLMKPKSLSNNYTFLQTNYMNMRISGDFFAKKGKYFLVGDASGHGTLANKSAKFIQKYFMNNRFSCIMIDEFFRNLDTSLKENKLRSAVLSVLEYTKKGITICGIGNIGILSVTNRNIEYLSQTSGIVGEVFSSLSTFRLKLEKNKLILLFSDGVDEKKLYNMAGRCKDIYLLSICALFFSDIIDDKLVFVLKGE